MPYCKYCGSKNDSDAVFCTECGKRIINSPTTKKELINSPSSTSPPVSNVRHNTQKNPQPVYRDSIVSKWTEEDERAFNERLTNYTLLVHLFSSYLRKENGGVFSDADLALWHEVEAFAAEKYGFSDISIFRWQDPNHGFKPSEESAPPRRNKSYNKKDKEYWSQFKTYAEEDDSK